jgi:hypothetical protein
MEEEENKKSRTIIMKVSKEKKCLSIYGIQRFPVSLYKEQWEIILDNAENIREFIKENQDTLSSKS